MPEISKDVIRFKNRIDEKYDKVKQEIAKLEQEIEALKARKNSTAIQQSLTDENHNIDDQIKRLRELLVIQRDHKKRLGTEVLRLGHRNPGLIQPEFEEE